MIKRSSIYLICQISVILFSLNVSATSKIALDEMDGISSSSETATSLFTLNSEDTPKALRGLRHISTGTSSEDESSSDDESSSVNFIHDSLRKFSSGTESDDEGYFYDDDASLSVANLMSTLNIQSQIADGSHSVQNADDASPSLSDLKCAFDIQSSIADGGHLSDDDSVQWKPNGLRRTGVDSASKNSVDDSVSDNGAQSLHSSFLGQSEKFIGELNTLFKSAKFKSYMMDIDRFSKITHAFSDNTLDLVQLVVVRPTAKYPAKSDEAQRLETVLSEFKEGKGNFEQVSSVPDDQDIQAFLEIVRDLEKKAEALVNSLIER